MPDFLSSVAVGAQQSLVFRPRSLADFHLSRGFGQKVAAYLGSDPVKVTCLGLKKEFLDRYDARTVLEANGLTPAHIVALA